MKKMLTAIVLLITALSFAQTPIIKDFRTIIADRPNEFKNLQKELLKDNVAGGFKEYSSTIPDLSFNRNLIINGTRGAQYLVIFNLDAMNEETKNFFGLVSKQYFAEIADMEKSGKYVVLHYKSDAGILISEVKDLAGEKILEYRIKPNEHLILFLGPKKQ
jgi:hypothetical protein